VVTGATKVLSELQQRAQWSQDSWLLQQAKAPIQQCLILLQDLVSSLADERLRSKQMLFSALTPSLDFIISLFPTYLHHADVLDPLMGFFLSLFHCMRAQVGASLTERTTHTFMSLLTREHLQETLTEEISLVSRMVEKFLRILQLLVSEGGGGDQVLLSSVIQFAMKQIYPIISEKAVPDMKAVLFDLFFQLLLNNWRYFFPHNVLSHMEGDTVDDVLEHREEFFAIMEAFGHSFLQKDITLFKQNLSSLETLNKKHKLYSKGSFP
jgi:adenylate kinase family enzyme